MNEYYRLCEHCEEYHDKSQMTMIHDGSYVCSRCLDDEYLLCNECDEEIGGLGAKKFCLAHKQHQLSKELDGLKFLIELDRKGKNDAVYYQCDNPDFEAYITDKGFKTEQGSFSDISLIAPELGIAAVNLSSGYYSPHTFHEYIIRSELLIGTVNALNFGN